MAAGREGDDPLVYLRAQTRWRPVEMVFWLATLLPLRAGAVLSLAREPDRHYRAVRLSLDLILGYAGLVSLGHAAYFGVGAYTAGLLPNTAGASR